MSAPVEPSSRPSTKAVLASDAVVAVLGWSGGRLVGGAPLGLVAAVGAAVLHRRLHSPAAALLARAGV